MKPLVPWLHKLTLVTIVVFMAIMWSNLGRDYLFDWDEGIYSVIGREMIASGDYLTPTWNGELWLEKPPLIAWITALGIQLGGANELGARLLIPLFSGLTLYAVYKLGAKWGGTLMGTASMAILGYFNLFLSRARTLSTDGLLLAGISWTLWLIVSGAKPWLVGVVMGLSVMAKGPAGLLAVIIALPLLYKKSRQYLSLVIGACLLVILPWHLYAYLTHGSAFITPYLMEQVLTRATSPIEFHMESRWFYFVFLFKDLGLGVILTALVGYLLLGLTWLKSRKITQSYLMIWWLVVPLVIFTLAKTRLSWYILPVYPAISLAIGSAISQFNRDRVSRGVVTILVVGMLAQLLWHARSYIEPAKVVTTLTPPLQIARALSQYQGGELAMLVSESERIAHAILPASQTISSSFRYGGAPSVVWYSAKHVRYYYNYDDFKQDLVEDPAITTAILTTGDQDKIPAGFIPVAESDNYLGYTRGESYAQR